MKNIISMSILAVAIMLCSAVQLSAKELAPVREISSVKELAEAAKKSNGNIKMTPGVYKMKDYLTAAVINSAQPDVIKRKAMIRFSGKNNIFDLTGVTIEVDTKQLASFKSSINEFHITGSGNTIKGLTITDIGNFPPSGGGARSFVVTGDDCVIDGVTINMNGSYPSGYGDLLGKGGNGMVKLKKHSGLLVEGKDIKILNCSIYSNCFGHLFFIQGGRNVHFENCYAEGVIRSTDEMLAEKSGPAYDLKFQSVYKNHDNPESKSIMPGYAKSVNECGFRNYGQGGPDKNTTGALTFINCRAKNTRIGFALTRMEADMTVEGCEAQGCEVGYSIAGATIKNCRGDAKNGPLLHITKSSVASDVELELMPATSNYIIHCLAAIVGSKHKVKFTKFNGETRDKELPILIGTSRPVANNGYSPMGSAPAVGIEIINTTGMPINLNTTAKNSIITSNGKVTDKGTDNKVTKAE